MQPLRLQIVSRALKRASIFLIFNDANGRYDLEKKGDAILMSKIVLDFLLPYVEHLHKYPI